MFTFSLIIYLLITLSLFLGWGAFCCIIWSKISLQTRLLTAVTILIGSWLVYVYPIMLVGISFTPLIEEIIKHQTIYIHDKPKPSIMLAIRWSTIYGIYELCTYIYIQAYTLWDYDVSGLVYRWCVVVFLHSVFVMIGRGADIYRVWYIALWLLGGIITHYIYNMTSHNMLIPAIYILGGMFLLSYVLFMSDELYE
jgi:hypothetical protein